ncbi:MAG: hypothetical protein AAF658_13595, partial [Myxococcota bacterium]
MRAAPSGRDPVGTCRRFVWAAGDVQDGDFTGALWINAETFETASAVDIPDGALEVQFFAWAVEDGEVVEFGAGSQADGDIGQTRQNRTLSTSPQLFTIALTNLNGYSAIFGGFQFAFTSGNNPNGAEIFIDDIRWIGPSENNNNDNGNTNDNANNNDSTLSLPMIVSENYDAAGFFGNGPVDQTTVNDGACPMRPNDARGDCYEVTYDETAGDAFAGVTWLNGESFVNNTPLAVEAGATQLTFYAWGAAGGEVVSFGYNFTDRGIGRNPVITLGTTPQRYTIPVTQAYTTIEQPFFWSAGLGVDDPAIRFFVTDIVWEGPAANAPAPVALPMVVDTSHAGRAGFGTGGPPLHTETTDCTMRGVMNAVGECHRFVWAAPQATQFSGAFWINGSGFGDAQLVRVETGAVAVSFYAWSTSGDDVVRFGTGLGNNDGTEFLADPVTLTTTPTRYFVPLRVLGDYTGVVSPFSLSIVADGNLNGVEFFVDDIQWLDAEDADAGCTDSNAKNFDDTAEFDDGSCLYDITFNVDMRCPDALDPQSANAPIGEVTGFEDVRLTGTFNGFGTEIIMTDANADDIWTVELTDLNLPTSELQYLYITGEFVSRERLGD